MSNNIRIVTTAATFVLLFVAAACFLGWQKRLDANGAAEELEATVDGRIWAGDTGYAQRNILDPTHVMARIIEIENPLWDINFARSTTLEFEEGFWELELC